MHSFFCSSHKIYEIYLLTYLLTYLCMYLYRHGGDEYIVYFPDQVQLLEAAISDAATKSIKGISIVLSLSLSSSLSLSFLLCGRIELFSL